MNVGNVINKLKAANMISNSEEGMNLFTTCFNKFGISLLLLKSESEFEKIVDLLYTKNISLQKANGMYALRLFAVSYNDLENIIDNFESIDELDFLRSYPEKIADSEDINMIYNNMKSLKETGSEYKNKNEYNLDLLLKEIKKSKYSFLGKYLNDKTLIKKLENKEVNEGEEDLGIALDLQRIENRICEDYLLPVDDGWKIVIDDKEVNSFQEIKNTILAITELNLPITYEDAFILVLFYETKLSEEEVDEIVKKEIIKGEI